LTVTGDRQVCIILKCEGISKIREVFL